MINDLIPIYGEPFLRFVLAIDDGVLGSSALDNHRREIAEALRNRAFSLAPGEAQFDQYSRLLSLGQWSEDAQTSVPNAFRLYCGGALPELPGSDDPLLNCLEILARDTWPALLIPTPQEGPATFWSSAPLIALSHPQAIVAAKAFLADEALRRLYPQAESIKEVDRDQALGLSTYWISGLGGMAHHELLPLIGFLGTNARLWNLIEGGSDNFDGLLESLPKALAALRRLAMGETVDVPYLVGFRGVSMEDGLDIPLPCGLLRPSRPIDRSFLLPDAKEVSIVLVGRYPLQLLGIHPREADAEMPDFSRYWRRLQQGQLQSERELDLTRLAVLLASPSGLSWGLSQISSLVVDPTAAGGAPRATTYEDNLRGGELDAAGAERVASWWPQLRDRLPGSLDIAMRRTLSAAARRSDPVDGFVDAIIAWENCFGTEQETTFRVTGAIASLLEPDSAEERLALLARLKGLYSKRSRVVHGALHLSTEDANAARDEALEIAIRALQGLLQSRPELLALDSPLRSTRLMLG